MTRYTLLFGGKAGQGPNILTNLLGSALVKYGYYVFYSRDYQSLIRGGHNFNVLTFCENPLFSNDYEVDLMVALDEVTEETHKKELKKNAVILKGKKENMYYAGAIFKLLGIEFKALDDELKILKKRYEENIVQAKKGYQEEKRTIAQLERKKTKAYFTSGSESIAQGAIKSGLDVYYGYPMTPSTPVLGELAGRAVDNRFLLVELENEISVIGAAIGSAITGAKTMVGTSGGGFDLMTENISLAGMADVPLVVYLAQRPGPATGVPTYTSQGDLNLTRHAGHGEFQRVVLAPGDPKECQELVSRAFYFSQTFKIPAIVISDKHLAESYYTLTEPIKITKSKKLTSLKKYNSYEHDDYGISTEDARIVRSNFDRRLKKQEEIAKEAEKFEGYKLYGKRDSKNMIVSWGSTKGAILDCIKDLDLCFLQIIHIDPFPKAIERLLRDKNLILIENNSTAQLGQLIAEKTGVFIGDKHKILRYDARPFLHDELKLAIKGRMR
ncbi:MAG: 2-oxoacid:acceptor oxidoreductase family protein [Nanoarchaeota archaeon]|nr:2-oxoacid:acceptor oxidoreductase family protein [Nanoarchaeota archaeon]